jgi:hypothetical protein
VNADSIAVREVDSLARSLAIALADPGARLRLTEALRTSTADEEHKVFLGQAIGSLRSGARALGENFGVVRAIGAPRNFRNLAQEIEVYLPVRIQRDAYSGDAPLLVAWQLFEDSAPIAYDNTGQRRTLSLDAPPNEPVLVLVPRESRLNQVRLNTNCRNETRSSGGIGTWSCAQAAMNVPGASTEFASMELECDPMTSIIPCDGGPGPGGAPPLPGFYLTDAHLDDLHEPWPLGSPEITYLVTTVPTFGNTFDTRISCLSDAPLPTGQFFLDHDSHTQSFAIGGTHMFLNQIQIGDMEAIAAARGMPTADIKVTVWEDDEGTKCTYDEDNGLARLTSAVNAVQGVVGIFKGFNKCVNTVANPQDSSLIGNATRRFRALSNLCGILRIAGLVTTALEVLNGGDDLIGVAEAVSNPSMNGGWSHVIVNSSGSTVGRFNITGVDQP